MEVFEMKNSISEPHKSSIGTIDANIMALIVYVAATVVGWIPVVRYVAWLIPLVIFFMEKSSRFVKFHAMQAFILNAVGQALAFILVVVIGGIITATWRNSGGIYGAVAGYGLLVTIVVIISIILTIFALIAMYNAYKYKEYHIPVIGNWADKLTSKFSAKP
jgi:uncharacterized membrane protein